MIKHYELEIDPDNPFYNCQLDRKKYANVLLDIVSTYNEGFVLAINNKWGTGKTTFIKMWEQELKKNGFQTVMFNAWENDFEKLEKVKVFSQKYNCIVLMRLNVIVI